MENHFLHTIKCKKELENNCGLYFWLWVVNHFKKYLIKFVKSKIKQKQEEAKANKVACFKISANLLYRVFIVQSVFIDDVSHSRFSGKI